MRPILTTSGRHHVKPEEAEQALVDEPVDLDYAIAENEERWTSIGHTDKMRILKLVWTLQGELVRVITAMEASKREAFEYLRLRGI
ncbi:MAG TPA: BrnT family toxin [Bryobacteraceae bacterium]|nr:BrnT family toxin [Bryobacteraceae bacterium]